MNRNLIFVAPLVCSMQAVAFDQFVVKDIRLEGLQRISIGTVFSYLPIKVGDNVSQADTTAAIQALYKTGFFKDVRMEREGDVLVIFVAERPAVAEIKISGNSQIPSDHLNKSLKDIGLADGRIFDRSILDSVEQELKRQYYSLGKYAVKVVTTVKPLERNRVAVAIEIAEGDEADVYAVNIVGNKSFTNEKLLSLMTSAHQSIFGGRTSFSRQVLAGDLENLRSFYMDRGYVNFNIDSTQVSLSPDKQEVYITINIVEGSAYTIRDIKLAGELLLEQSEYNKLISFVKGEIFSRRKIIDSRKSITDRLAELGYPFANVNIAPNLDEDSKTVELTVYVDPGRRTYVRRININGNAKTRDEVIRREMRQLEGDWMSSNKIALSKQRLDRTGFFQDVSIETPAVAGVQDQVDLDITVIERPTGSLNAGIGYSDTQGALFNFSLSQENFMGTGKFVAISFDNSQVTQSYTLNLRDPYYTDDGISRNLSFFSRKVDAQEADISNYVINTNGVSLSYSIPSGEFTSYSLGATYEHASLITNSTLSATEILNFVNTYGSKYDTLSLNMNWIYDNRNRAIFASDGKLLRLGFESTVPGNDLEYYKIGLKYQQYFPLSTNYSLSYNIELDYGNAYGDLSQLPPFKNYFAGGSRSVRGFEGNSLGPKDSKGDPLGGDRRVVTNLELYLPNPFSEQEKSARLSLFVDGGYVYGPGKSLDLGEMRYAAGIGLLWLTPVGALRFSLAEPLNAKEGDDTTSFQFTLGSAF